MIVKRCLFLIFLSMKLFWSKIFVIILISYTVNSLCLLVSGSVIDSNKIKNRSGLISSEIVAKYFFV